MGIACFMLTETTRVRRWLRRYQSFEEGISLCPGPFGYHNGMTLLGDFEQPREGLYERTTVTVTGADPRWPVRCGHCDYFFEESAQRQVFERRLYENVERGLLTTVDEAPPGAMWWETWQTFGGAAWHARGGGPHLWVMLSGSSAWDIDAPSRGDLEGTGWERTGEPPQVTATPSILIANKDGSAKWHGFLRDGELIEA